MTEAEAEPSALELFGELALYATLSAVGWWAGIVGGAIFMMFAISADKALDAILITSPLVLLGSSLAGVVGVSAVLDGRTRRRFGCLAVLVFPLVSWAGWTVVFGSGLLVFAFLSVLVMG